MLCWNHHENQTGHPQISPPPSDAQVPQALVVHEMFGRHTSWLQEIGRDSMFGGNMIGWEVAQKINPRHLAPPILDTVPAENCHSSSVAQSTCTLFSNVFSSGFTEQCTNSMYPEPAQPGRGRQPPPFVRREVSELQRKV